jgi:hypothetical protein
MVSICWRSSCSSSSANRQSSRWWHYSFARVRRSVELFCLLPKEHTHTHTHTHTHATGLPKERRPGRCICMCRSGKNYHRSVQRLLSSLCMSAAATDLSSICLFCSAVCLNQHACPLIDSLTQHHPHHHTRNCLAHISHHHPISISITTSRPACPRTYTSTSTSTSTYS